MAVAINYGSAFLSFNSGKSLQGIKDYFGYYDDTYESEDHASNLVFAGPSTGTTVNIGGEIYPEYPAFPDPYPTETIGEYLYSETLTPAGAGMDWVITAGEVPIEDDDENEDTLDLFVYTFNSSTPPHTVFGNIAKLTFGNDGWNGTNGLDTTFFDIVGIGDAIGYGLTDEFGLPDVYDTVIPGVPTPGDNPVQDMVFQLMGGMGGSGGSSELIGIFDEYGTVQTGLGIGYADRFDPFNSVDTFVLNGGYDIINAGFQVGAGGDVIDIVGLNKFAGDENEAAGDVFYTGGNGWLIYEDTLSNWHSVQITGVTSGITADNFIV